MSFELLLLLLLLCYNSREKKKAREERENKREYIETNDRHLFVPIINLREHMMLN